jgi:hypothetical protein
LLPARVYIYKDGAEFRLTPVDAVLPIRSDTFYRDTYYSKTPDPATMEVVAADQYHYLLLKGAGKFYLPPASIASTPIADFSTNRRGSSSS